MPVFEARHVWKRYGPTVALRDVSIEVGEGLTVIMGPNGSGKTTLLRLLVGLSRPSRGTVRALGVDPWRRRPWVMARIGVAFEDLALPWWTTALDYLRLVAWRKGADWGEARELAQLLGVDSYWGKTIRGYSSGMKKRVILAQALLGDPEAIVLDEPYTLLDREAVARLHSIVEERLRGGAAVIIATHVITGLEEEFDTIALLHNGELALASRREDVKGFAKCTYKTENPAEELAKLLGTGIARIEVDNGRVTIWGDMETLARKCGRPRIDVRRLVEEVLAPPRPS